MLVVDRLAAAYGPAQVLFDIGFTVGYNETSAFSAAFRKTTGVTPTDYHRNL